MLLGKAAYLHELIIPYIDCEKTMNPAAVPRTPYVMDCLMRTVSGMLNAPRCTVGTPNTINPVGRIWKFHSVASSPDIRSRLSFQFPVYSRVILEVVSRTTMLNFFACPYLR